MSKQTHEVNVVLLPRNLGLLGLASSWYTGIFFQKLPAKNRCNEGLKSQALPFSYFQRVSPGLVYPLNYLFLGAVVHE